VSESGDESIFASACVSAVIYALFALGFIQGKFFNAVNLQKLGIDFENLIREVTQFRDLQVEGESRMPLPIR